MKGFHNKSSIGLFFLFDRCKGGGGQNFKTGKLILTTGSNNFQLHAWLEITSLIANVNNVERTLTAAMELPLVRVVLMARFLMLDLQQKVIATMLHARLDTT